MASLIDQLELADELWMTGHDRPDGRPLIQDKPLNIGLACALLIEALLLKWITDVTDDGELQLIDDADRYQLPDDPAVSGIVTELIREQQAPRTDAGRSVDDWIPRLAVDAQPLVLRRLRAGGHVQEHTVGGLFRASRTVFTPALTTTSGWPTARVKRHLAVGEQMSETDLALSGLIIAVGLDSHALAGLERREYGFLAEQTRARLRPAISQIVMRAEASVGRIALTR